MKDITVSIEPDGKISHATMREMFDNSLEGSSLLNPSDWAGFVVGVRCVEKVMSAAGINTILLLDGRVLTQNEEPLKTPTYTPTDTDR